jgi:histidinol-phosphatase (PHP family)
MGGAEIHDVAERYFAQVEADVRLWPDYDALAHLTLPARYLKRRTGITLDLKRYGDRIEAILKILAQRGKGLEINMSGMRSSHATACPARGS